MSVLFDALHRQDDYPLATALPAWLFLGLPGAAAFAVLGRVPAITEQRLHPLRLQPRDRHPLPGLWHHAGDGGAGPR